MSRTIFTLLLILLVLLSPQRTLAQQSSLSSQKTQAENAALREKAFNLLESAAGQLGSLQSPENRARLGANIADSLWDHDEKRARALLALVQDDIRQGMANRDLEDPKDQLSLKVFLKLRIDTVERIAKHDGELALAFLKSTEFISDKPLPPSYTENARGLELRLAKQIAASNPELTVKLLRKALAEGFSEELLPLLRQLNRTHKEQALTLYKEIVQKLHDVDLQDWRTREFTQNLILTFRPPTPDHPTFRELTGIVVTAALGNGCGSNANLEGEKAEFCLWAVSVIPQLEKLDPRAAQLRRWIPDQEYVNVAPEAVHEFFGMVEDGTIDDLLAFAARHPDVADDIYWHAVMKACAAGDFEQARTIATQRMVNAERKEAALSQINHRQRWLTADEKQLAELQTILANMPNPADRVRALVASAMRFGSTDRNISLKLLKQASDITDSMRPGRPQTEAQLSLAMLYCLEKNDRGFAIMESLMPKLNELVDAAMKLDDYETGYVRDGEWNMSANGTTGVLLTQLAENAGYFAWCDFDRAMNLAAQFDRTEIRLMAQVKLAQAILDGPPKRLASDRRYYY